MKVSEIAELLRSGEMTLETAGHRTNGNAKRFLERYDEDVEMSKGKNDGKWDYKSRDGQTPKEVDAGMRQFYKERIDFNVKDNGTLGFFRNEEYCFGCGQRLHWVLTGNKLQLRNYYDREKGDFPNYPIDYKCPFAIPEPTRGEITVSSNLLFANFFEGFEDSSKDDEYTEEWSLNCLAGRKRITEYKAKQNIAYGQMGNMSIGIYVNPTKDSIIVGPNYHPAEMDEFKSDKAYKEAIKKPVFPGYKKVGGIILDVWRWEATDIKTLGEKTYKKELKHHEDRGLVELKVKHGIWSFEHYYDTMKDEDGYLYSRFTKE